MKWLAKTATFTQAVSNAYEVAIMGGGYVYVEKDTTEDGSTTSFVPSVLKFLEYTDSDGETRSGGYLTIDDDNSEIAGSICDAIAAADTTSSETQAAVGFNVTAASDVEASVTAGSALLSLGAGIKKTGSGTLTLSGAFTALGEVNVSAGSIAITTTAESMTYSLAAGTYVSKSGSTYTFSNTYTSDSDCTITDTTNIGGSVTIPSSWIATTDIADTAESEGTTVPALLAPTSTVSADNGYNYFTCYALGLDPTDSTDKPIVNVTANADGTFSVTITHADGKTITNADGVTATAMFYKYDPSEDKYSETTYTSGTVTPADVVGTSNVGYVKAVISISAQ